MICKANNPPEPCCCSDIPEPPCPCCCGPEAAEYEITVSGFSLLCDPPAEIRLTIPAHMLDEETCRFSSYARERFLDGR